MPTTTANRPLSRRLQVLVHASTGALTEKTIARITGSKLSEVQRWKRQAGISLMARRRLAAQRYRDNYKAMLIGLEPLRREVRLLSHMPSTTLNLRVISRRSRSGRPNFNSPVQITVARA